MTEPLADALLIDRPGIRDVLAELDVDEDTGRAALDGRPGEDVAPWYVRVLVGGGAWVSALLFVTAVAASKIAETQEARGSLGLTACIGGIFLRRGARSEFPVQLALAMSVGGRFVLYSALGQGSAALAWAAAIAVESAVVVVYPDVVGRFLATLGACFALLGLVEELRLPWPSMHLAVLGIAALATEAWRREPELLAHPRLRALQRPAAYGLVVALMTALMAGLWLERDLDGQHRFSVVSAGLTLLLLLVERDVLRHALAHSPPRGGYREAAARAGERTLPAAAAPPETRALVYGGTLAVGLLGQLVPGLLGALLVMTLAAHRRNRLLFGLATVFLIFFGSHFYYSLRISLLAKSGALLGSGVLLLALRLPLSRRAAS